MFDFSEVQGKEGHREYMSRERQRRTIASLHAILKPFLLRRVKNDVETNLPKKREYILYAPMTNEQQEIYKKIQHNDIRAYLEEKAIARIGGQVGNLTVNNLKRKAGSGTTTPNKSNKSSRSSTPASSIRSGRRRRRDYKEVSDREYFKQIEGSSSSGLSEDSSEEEERSRTAIVAKARKEVSHKKLQNPVMQLRLACNSPHHFSWPWQDSDPDRTLITESGKMIMLDRLVPALFEKGHKVILFSQFQTQLDMLQDWAEILHDWTVCRIDGGVKAADRQDQIQAFNTDPDCRLFLLSTRAGGLGINLTAADTVILYDSDWNPQQDLQAQDRAHRIGQTRPVIVYRLATKGTIEQTLLEKADGKRRLEKLVIQKDKFRSILNQNKKAKDDDLTELQRILAESDDFETYNPSGEVLTDADIEVLTDRSEKAYERAAKGEDAGDKFKITETKSDGADILGSLG